MIALTRAFGWHRPQSTPCGQPVPIAEAHAMLELSRTPGISQSELARAIGLRKSTVSRIVGNLERRGWVDRRRSSEDRRVAELVLTDEGLRASAQIGKARAARMEAVLDAIPPSDRDAVVRALDVLVDATHRANRTPSRSSEDRE